LPDQYAWGALGAVIGSAITSFFTWLAQRGKSSAEIEVAVLAEWQKLNSALSDRVAGLEKELAVVRRRHSDEIEEMRNKHRAEMRALRELNEGLQRSIAQNSQSTAHLMGEPGEKKP
jgi:hypothetical protein